MRLAIIFLLSFPVLFTKAQTGDSIQIISPSGDFRLPTDTALIFQWESNFLYDGTYRLKILASESGDSVPNILPDSNLFFLQDSILGNQLIYPPTGPAFDTATTYWWQVETTGLVNDSIIRSPVVSIQPIMEANMPCLDSADLSFAIRDFVGIRSVTEICSGDPILFAAANIPAAENQTLTWQFNDGTNEEWQAMEDASFQPISDVSLYTFPVPANHTLLQVNCDTSSTGFMNRRFRAQLMNISGQDTCVYFSPEQSLRICCPLAPASIAITTADSMDIEMELCIQDSLNLNVGLISSDAFLNPAAEFVRIQWFVNGVAIEQDNQTRFSLNDTPDAEEVCIEAIVTNCGGKTQQLSQCISVTPNPVCGTISLTSPPIEPIQEGDTTVYLVCPEFNGVLEAFGFADCTLAWEYSLNPASNNWLPLGVSNSVQNTNVIPKDGRQSMFYRARCSSPQASSSCAPCMSNLVEIRIEDLEPSTPTIDCRQKVWCQGDVFESTVDVIEENTDYAWYVNGIELSRDTTLSYALAGNTCFELRATNGCTSVTSATCCVEVCTATANISCPLEPNNCACLGDPIILFAGGSESSCNNDLLYEWTWIDASGMEQSSTSITITDIPAPAGTTYTLTVTDTTLGCSDTTTSTIIPCNKQ